MEAGPPIGCPVFLGEIIIKRKDHITMAKALKLAFIADIRCYRF